MLDPGRGISAFGTWLPDTAPTHYVGYSPSLELIAGRPAIAYYGSPRRYGENGSQVRYFQATDAAGSGWGVPRVLVRGEAITSALREDMAITGRDVQLFALAGRPFLTLRHYGHWSSANPSERALCFGGNDDSGVNWNEDAGSWQKTVELDRGLNLQAAPALAEINDQPAIAYPGNQLRYVAAANSTGTKWNPPVVGFDKAVECASLAEVNGRPAIAFLASGLFYLRANDANGNGWPIPVKVDLSGRVGQSASLRVIDGRPAIAYHDADNGDLKFVRASDADGAVWAAPTTVDGAGDVGRFASLAEADGKPVIAYWAGGSAGDLRIIKALDSTGTSWEPPVTLDGEGVVGEFVSLGISAGGWCASYYDRSNRALKVAREGSPPETVDGGARVGFYLSAAVIGGFPCVSYYDQENHALKFSRAGSPSGSGWGFPRLSTQPAMPACIRRWRRRTVFRRGVL